MKAIKHVITCLLVIAVVFTAGNMIGGSTCVYAADDRPVSGTCGKNLKWKLSSKGTLTISGSGAMTNYTRDSKTDTVYIKNSDKPDDKSNLAPFYDRDDIKKVVFKKGVTASGNYAFYGCDNLKEVVFPSSKFTKIAAGTFRKCTGLESITLPSTLKTVGNTAFYNCTSLKEIVIPKKVTKIGTSVFRNCRALQSVSLPAGITSIGTSAFRDCRVLEQLELPESLTKINSSAFYNCYELGKLIIPESVTTIGSSAFYGMKQIEEITIPEGITSIGSSTFRNCTELKTVNLPSTVTSIGKYAFRECRAMESLKLPENLTTIDVMAFFNCHALKAIEIPETVTTIGDSAFYGLSQLTEITIPEGIDKIDADMFYGCSNLKIVKLPETVTSIGEGAFRYCESMETISLPESVTAIGHYAFESCSALAWILIPANVKTIGYKSIPPKATIACNRDSFAESYAVENKYRIQYIEDIHDCEYDDGVITREPNCFQNGIKTFTCSICGGTYTEEFPMIDHSYIESVIAEPTCFEKGLVESTCIYCGRTDEVFTPMTAHDYVASVTKATPAKPGRIVNECIICGHSSAKVIPKVSTVTLSRVGFTYSGKKCVPTVTVKNGKNVKLAEGTDYTVTIRNGNGKVVTKPVNVGRYKVSVVFKGNYKGTVEKYYKINPQPVSLKSLQRGNDRFTAKWTGAGKQLTGYQIRYSTQKNITAKNSKIVTVKGSTSGTATVKNLKDKKKYYVQVRTYKTVNGAKCYSAWSKSKTVTTK